jgi:hypothetical protein
LKALTIWPAWQHFEEDSKGTIEVGKLADFVILSDNPMTVPPEQLADLKVLETIKEGVSIYKRPAGSVAISSPAMFGLARPDAHDTQHGIPGVKHVHGDGCFNPGLSVLMQALYNAGSTKRQALGRPLPARPL